MNGDRPSPPPGNSNNSAGNRFEMSFFFYEPGATPPTDGNWPSDVAEGDFVVRFDLGPTQPQDASATDDAEQEEEGAETYGPPRPPNLNRSQEQRRPYNFRPSTVHQQSLGQNILRQLFQQQQRVGGIGRRQAGVNPRFAEGLTQIIMDILMNTAAAQNLHTQGQPPASKAAKEALKFISGLDWRLLMKCPECAVCQEEFFRPTTAAEKEDSADDDEEEEAADGSLHTAMTIRQMPCRHLFHEKCLFTWLENSNQCPICRYELMTDNDDYNRTVKERMAPRDEELLKEETEDLIKYAEKQVNEANSSSTGSTALNKKRRSRDESVDFEKEGSMKRTRGSSSKLNSRSNADRTESTSTVITPGSESNIGSKPTSSRSHRPQSSSSQRETTNEQPGSGSSSRRRYNLRRRPS